MFVAAMLDAWPELLEPLQQLLARLALPAAVAVEHRPHHDGVLVGSRFVVTVGGQEEQAVQHTHNGHTHSHAEHVPYEVVRRRLRDPGLPEAVRRRAQAIFELLAEAEGRVHGKPIEEVEFHEVGAWDALVDIVSAAFVVEACGATSFSTSPLPLGSGLVRTAHGWLPVPAPATALLMEGMAVRTDDIPGERVTPTGAAILRHLRPVTVPDGLSVGRVGYGFGRKKLRELPNTLRVTELTSGGALQRDQVGQVSFHVDDQTPEDLAVGLERLRARSDVLELLQRPAFGKKGRMVVEIEVWTQPQAALAVAEAALRETTTLGVRIGTVERVTLPRSQHTSSEGVRVKLARRPGGACTAKAEMDDLAQAGSAGERATVRKRAEDEIICATGRGHEQ
jgi:uncharacterized protein (TIGR00299 family) protein